MFSLIFDMDGVIVDSNPFHRKAWKVFSQKHNISITDEDLNSKVFGRSGHESLPTFFSHPLTSEQVSDFVKEIDKTFRELFAPHIKPVEGLEEFIIELRKQNYKYAIATSAPLENIDFIMESTGLRKYFDIIIDASQITRSKPSPEIYLITAARLNASPSECIVIEDSISGIESAVSAGMKVIGISTTHTAEELNHTDLIINNFNDLTIPMLNQLLEK